MAKLIFPCTFPQRTTLWVSIEWVMIHAVYYPSYQHGSIPHLLVVIPLLSLYHLFLTGRNFFEAPDPHDQATAVLAICDDCSKWLSRLEIVSVRSISRNSRSYHISYIYLVIIVPCLTKCPCTSYPVLFVIHFWLSLILWKDMTQIKYWKTSEYLKFVTKKWRKNISDREIHHTCQTHQTHQTFHTERVFLMQVSILSSSKIVMEDHSGTSSISSS